MPLIFQLLIMQKNSSLTTCVVADGKYYAISHGIFLLQCHLNRFRKCRLTTSGPWHEIGNTKIIDVSLLYDENTESFKAWAIASNGDALYRRGVTKSNPAGTSWEHIVANNQPLVSISLSKVTGVWAIGRNGI